MKNLSSTIILSFFLILTFQDVSGQKVEKTYRKGCPYQVDTYSLSRLSYVQTTYFTNCDENLIIQSKGPYVRTWFDMWSKRGYWKYWYKNGELKEECHYHYRLPSKDKYINQWVEDGNQLLINGNGLMYETRPGPGWRDSMVFKVKNFQKNGEYVFYRKLQISSYHYVRETGTCVNNNKEGLSVTYYPNGDTFFTVTYKDDEYYGVRMRYSEAGILLDSGFVSEQVKFGLWTFYDSLGNKTKIIDYGNGKQTMKVKGFENGKLGFIGEFKRKKALDTINVINDYGESETALNRRAYKYVKHGWWEYYNFDGALIRREKYKRNLLIE